MITIGPTAEDACFSVHGTRSAPSSTEYIDIGDHILLTGNHMRAKLNRDPVFYPDPAGETWYISYGEALYPVLQDYTHGHDTWPQQTEELQLSLPGTLPPKESMVGAIPYPVSGNLPIPAEIQSLAINGEGITATSRSFDGPWQEDMVLSWEPSTPTQALTLSIRLLGQGEAAGSCSCDADCGEGLSCLENQCYSVDGASDVQLAELVCTLKDDGSFSLASGSMAELLSQYQPHGILMVVSRITEAEFEVPDILSHNGKRLKHAPIRTRGVDAIMTRLEMP